VLGGDTAESWPGRWRRQTPADAQGIEELRELLARFVGDERARRALAGGPLSVEAALARTERVLSGTLGAASARVIVAAFGRRGRLLPRSARALIDEASQAISYNYEICATRSTMSAWAFAAFDRDGNVEIFNTPHRAAVTRRRGRRRRCLAAVVRRRARKSCPAAPARGAQGPTRSPRATAAWSSCASIRCRAAGSFATCNDVTNRVHTAEALRDSDRQLRRAAETLEQRVAARTASLRRAAAEAEAANLGKTRFIAAASHDLLQPLHAARLFTAAMMDRDPGTISAARSMRAWARSNRFSMRCSTSPSSMPAPSSPRSGRSPCNRCSTRWRRPSRRSRRGAASSWSWRRRGRSCRPIPPSCAASCRTC